MRAVAISGGLPFVPLRGLSISGVGISQRDGRAFDRSTHAPHMPARFDERQLNGGPGDAIGSGRFMDEGLGAEPIGDAATCRSERAQLEGTVLQMGPIR